MNVTGMKNIGFRGIKFNNSTAEEVKTKMAEKGIDISTGDFKFSTNGDSVDLSFKRDAAEKLLPSPSESASSSDYKKLTNSMISTQEISLQLRLEKQGISCELTQDAEAFYQNAKKAPKSFFETLVRMSSKDKPS